MKFNFKIQSYQTDAVESIINVFDGEIFDEFNTYCFDRGNKENYELNFVDDVFIKDASAFSNHPITISDDQLLKISIEYNLIII